MGEATVFVSWFLATPIETLLDALANFLKQKGLREEDTYFWVCDYVIRQTDVKTDLARLGDCVSAVGHTVRIPFPSEPCTYISFRIGSGCPRCKKAAAAGTG